MRLAEPFFFKKKKVRVEARGVSNETTASEAGNDERRRFDVLEWR